MFKQFLSTKSVAGIASFTALWKSQTALTESWHEEHAARAFIANPGKSIV